LNKGYFKMFALEFTVAIVVGAGVVVSLFLENLAPSCCSPSSLASPSPWPASQNPRDRDGYHQARAIVAIGDRCHFRRI
jgi:hypothetical protein